MTRGPKHHLKRLNAPKHWMLSKMGGIFAPKPLPGTHGDRESIPLLILIRNRLKYASNANEVEMILKARHIKVDGKVRTEKKFPSGFMDVVSIDKTNDNYRLLYDTKGRFILHPLTGEEAKFKLCKVLSRGTQRKGVPYVRTHDGRHIRYPDPMIKVNDTIKVDIETGRPVGLVKFAEGNLCMVTGGHSQGRVGQIVQREKHPGSYEIIHVRDTTGNVFTTRLSNVFVLGEDTTSLITLPKGQGLKLTTVEDRLKKINLRKSEQKSKQVEEVKEEEEDEDKEEEEENDEDDFDQN